MAARKIVCLPGDGIGPEVSAEAVRVLEALPLELDIAAYPFGGAAIDAVGEPLPAATLEACRGADAVLLGAVGGPKWDGGSVRPEQGLIGLRKELDVYANLRPALGEGVDLLIVRELVGGLYYGARGTREDGTVFDTCEYHPDQVERVARRAFELARGRAGRLLSVDKANVMETSRMWRRVVSALASDYPDVELRHGLADSVAMQIVVDPYSFDTLVMENTFGDILSDVAAGVTGGLGLASSASLGDRNPGIFEPVHGSAPDIAGTGAANPTAMLRSLALLLEHGLGEPALARSLEAAVTRALDSTPTIDLGGLATTSEFGSAVLDALAAEVAAWTGLLVGYPGPAGSHSAAATALLSPPGAGSEPLPSFIAVVEAIVSSQVALGVLPIENSLHGPVGETHDLLYEAPISIVSEVTLPIVHCVAAKTAMRLDEIRTFRSHPVAFDQCRDLIHSLGANCIPSASTSDAAREVAEAEEPFQAALSSREAADHHGLLVIAEDVGDRPAAFTRFVGIAPYTRVDRGPRWRTALSFVTDHQPGSLYHALGPFHRHGLNLVQLVSRPIPRSTFRYRFDMVLDGHPLDREVQTALVEIREWTREVRIFGSYAATGEQ